MATPGATGARVVRVLPDVPALRRLFDYLVPGAMGASVTVGSQVRVVLHGRRVGGWVVDDAVVPPAGVTLRPLAALRGIGPPPAVVDLAPWVAWRWAGSTAAVLRSASSPRAVHSLPPPGRTAAPASRWWPAAGGAPAVAPAPWWAEALQGGTAVVRLPPAADPWPVVAAAAALLGGHGDASATGEAPGVLVLVPERHVARWLASRLEQAGYPVAVVPEQWPAARAGGRVVLGTRSAALAPLPKLRAAVVLDAHDEAYRQEQAPTWDAWAVVHERARRDGAPCALVSPCPTLELLAVGRLCTVGRRAERSGWPPVEVVDRRGDDPRTGLFSPRVVELVRWAADQPGRRVLCVVNRTGRVRLLACAACGELGRCERCGGPVELLGPQDAGGSGRTARDHAPHAAPDARSGTPGPRRPGAEALACRRCGQRRPVVCPQCGATRIKALRVGVSRVREELQALSGTAVAELSATGASTGSPDAALAAVVVGTEAALHRLPAADVVVFLDFDAELLAPRFRAAEQALALLARAACLVAGDRAGRRPDGGAAGGRAPGRVVVQTRQPDAAVLQAAVLADPSRLTDREREIRRALRLPPFGAVAAVSGPSAGALGETLRAMAPADVEVHGPSDGTWWLRASDHDVLCDLLAAAPRPPGRVRVELDPVRA